MQTKSSKEEKQVEFDRELSRHDKNWKCWKFLHPEQMFKQQIKMRRQYWYHKFVSFNPTRKISCYIISFEKLLERGSTIRTWQHWKYKRPDIETALYVKDMKDNGYVNFISILYPNIEEQRRLRTWSGELGLGKRNNQHFDKFLSEIRLLFL
jgi:hypothetical protein